MATVNLLKCGRSNNGNSGYEKCNTKPARIEWLLDLPAGINIPAPALANTGVNETNAGLKALLQAEDPNGRAQIWGRFVGVENNSVEVQEYEYPDGSTETTRDEVYKVRLQHRNGMCYHKQLIRQNGNQGNRQIIMIDIEGQMWTGSLAADGSVTGLEMTRWYAPGYTPALGTDPSLFYLNVDFADASQLNLFSTVIQAGKGIGAKLQSLAVRDASFQLGGAPAGGVYPILALTGCGGKSIASYDTAGALATTAMFTVTNQLGAAVTVLGVTRGGTGDAMFYNVALDTSDADYTAATSLNFKFTSVALTSTAYLPYQSYDAVTGALLFTTPKV